MAQGKEMHRMGKHVYVRFEDIRTIERYVDAADWDADPKRVIAEQLDIFVAAPAAETVTVSFKPPVVATAAEVAVKQAEIEAEKAADDAKVDIAG